MLHASRVFFSKKFSSLAFREEGIPRKPGVVQGGHDTKHACLRFAIVLELKETWKQSAELGFDPKGDEKGRMRCACYGAQWQGSPAYCALRGGGERRGPRIWGGCSSSHHLQRESVGVSKHRTPAMHSARSLVVRACA